MIYFFVYFGALLASLAFGAWILFSFSGPLPKEAEDYIANTEGLDERRH